MRSEHSSLSRHAETVPASLAHRFGSRPHKRQSGVSLVELLLAIVIFALIGLIGLPNYALLQESFDRMNARAYLIQDLKRAQAEALTLGCRGVFTLSSDGRNYSFGCDFLEYSTPPTADSESFSRLLPGDIRVASSISDPIIFNSRGYSVTIGDIMQNVDLTLKRADNTVYASGTLLGTGLFTFDNETL